MSLTPRQQRFVDEYLIDLNATQAAVRAGYSARTAEQQGPRLLGNVGVAAAIQAAKSARAEDTGITAARVLQELWEIATADPNDLVQYRIGACRHCFGEGFGYQETAEEREARHGKWERGTQAEPFDEQGGVGFEPARDPNPACPVCCGEGEGRVYVADTRKLKGPARRLYAGVKTTKEGIEVKMHDKLAALSQVGRHLGMFTDRVDLTAKHDLTDELVAWLNLRS